MYPLEELITLTDVPVVVDARAYEFGYLNINTPPPPAPDGYSGVDP